MGECGMTCRVTDMHNEEVINVCDGSRLGCVDDVEIDTCTAQLLAIVIFGRPKCLGLMGREEDIVIGWRNIDVIGEDTILVHFECPCKPGPPPRRGRSILGGIFGG